MSFQKSLCKHCTLNGDCCCQDESQKTVNLCGMEEVLRNNLEISQRDGGQVYGNPDYEQFMSDKA